MWEAGALAALALLAWLWFDSMRAREHALAAGSRACGARPAAVPRRDRGMAWSASSRARREWAVALRRVLPIQFSDNGDNRRAGSIVMMGGEVESSPWNRSCCSESSFGESCRSGSKAPCHQKRWTETFHVQVEADVAAFEAYSSPSSRSRWEGEMLARPYSVRETRRRNVRTSLLRDAPDGPLTQRLRKLEAGTRFTLHRGRRGSSCSRNPRRGEPWLISTERESAFPVYPEDRGSLAKTLQQWSWFTRCAMRGVDYRDSLSRLLGEAREQMRLSRREPENRPGALHRTHPPRDRGGCLEARRAWRFCEDSRL